MRTLLASTLSLVFAAAYANDEPPSTAQGDFNGAFGRDLVREHHTAVRGTSHRH